MNRINARADVESSISTLLTRVEDGKVTRSAEFGNFFCAVENVGQMTIIERNFETSTIPVNIPFSCHEPSIQMLFSLNGQSVFNDRYDPFLLSPLSHCINFFRRYDCSNLLEENARQHDIAIRLKKSFYSDLIANHLTSADDRLSSMIIQQKEFNTINQHIPADPAILGLLRNIMECPYQGQMKSAFIHEHVKALFMLQLFHFNPIVAGKEIRYDARISQRDKEILSDVKSFIDKHFLDAASLETLSKNFGINEFKLKHGFKVLFDTSPIKYLQHKRLEYSMFLLRETDKSIKNIADEIGYSHAANFTIAFTKTFGNPPLHYRGRKRSAVFIDEPEMSTAI